MKILWHPSSVDKESTCLLLFVQVSIEWSNGLETLFSVLFFSDFNFFSVIHVTGELYWFPSPFLFGFIDVLISKWIISTVFRSDINWSFIQKFCSIDVYLDYEIESNLP